MINSIVVSSVSMINSIVMSGVSMINTIVVSGVSMINSIVVVSGVLKNYISGVILLKNVEKESLIGTDITV